MRYLQLTLILSFFLLSCASEVAVKNTEVAKDTATIKPTAIITDSKMDDSVQVDLSIKLLNENMAELKIDMSLFGDTWIVSPLEKNYPYGEMRLELQENNFLTVTDSISEKPMSSFISDENVEEPYKVITKQSELIQKIKLKSKQNFEVSGYIFFILEPVCRPYEIYFTISHIKENIDVRITSRIKAL
ncbi:MAG: hypothetical protein AB8B72_11825 [Crocinitomicaceae bacterium]